MKTYLFNHTSVNSLSPSPGVKSETCIPPHPSPNSMLEARCGEHLISAKMSTFHLTTCFNIDIRGGGLRRATTLTSYSSLTFATGAVTTMMSKTSKS